MIYCETIKSSKTYTPPKSGIYKIICVGGGGAGYVHDTSSAITSEAGGTTSFGSYVAASGGASGKDVVMLGGATAVEIQLNERIVDSGKNGFNGACEYGASSGMAVGYGYGASGAAYGGVNNKKYSSGQAGDVVSTIVELGPSASIACTIGKGGKGGAGNHEYAWSGADGAIIVQYLGESL